MKKTNLKRFSRSSLAYASYPFIGPQRAGRAFGRVPYITVPVSDYTVTDLEPPEPFTLPYPKGFPENAKWDGFPPFPVTQNQIAKVPGGLADSTGFVFNADGRPVHGASHPRKQMLKYRWRMRRDGIAADYMRNQDAPRHLPGATAVLTASNQSFYYHWIFDILPRLKLALEHAPDIDHLYLQRKLPFQHETLDILGIDPGRIVNAEDEPWIGTDQMIVPCHQIMTGHRHPGWVTDWMRQKFGCRQQSTDHGRRIYVSRSMARNRRVKNEDEVLAILEPLGFEIVHAEKYTFEEQISIFANAQAIVAPHGAGLANLVFCAPGTRVIELFPSMTMDCYYRLCDDLKLEYTFVKTRQFRFHRRVGEDFVIAPEDMKSALRQLSLLS